MTVSTRNIPVIPSTLLTKVQTGAFLRKRRSSESPGPDRTLRNLADDLILIGG